MENVINNGAVTELEDQFADAGDQQEMAQESVVTLSEILSEAQDNDAGNPDAGEAATGGETVENQGDDGPAEQVSELASAPQPKDYFRSQAEFDAAFSKRMANERARNRPYVEMGQAVMDVAGSELTSEEVKAAIVHALAEKRAKAYNTNYDDEMNNIRVEQRVAQRFAPRQPEQTPRQPAEDARGRAEAMMAAMGAIGDDAFNVAALQGNREAMAAWVNGATPAEVYKQYFAGGRAATPQPSEPQPAPRAKRPAPERAANSGPMGSPQRKLTKADIAKIDEAIDAHGGISLF